MMLSRLISLLKDRGDGMSLAEISHALQAQPSAVASMIDLLVKKDRLIEIGPDGECCTTCGLQSECNLLMARGKRYFVNHSGVVSQ